MGRFINITLMLQNNLKNPRRTHENKQNKTVNFGHAGWSVTIDGLHRDPDGKNG
jgi:hypothetical protein